MRLKLADRVLSLERPLVMGVLNVTPDSFSDGGRYQLRDAALRRAEQMIAEGAAIVDVGGESTRPGAEPVPEGVELDRVIPVIEALRELGCIISIDTLKPAVMDAACASGAVLINDINALQADGAIEVALRHRAAVCLMHMQGEPRNMQLHPTYGDVVHEVREFLQQRARICVAAGVDPESVLVDPGFGFGKSLDHNLRMLAALDRFCLDGYPVLVGLSRKSMFGQLLGASVERRLSGGLAATALAVWLGAHMVRAHDVAATVDAVAAAAAIASARMEMK